MQYVVKTMTICCSGVLHHETASPHKTGFYRQMNLVAAQAAADAAAQAAADAAAQAAAAGAPGVPAGAAAQANNNRVRVKKITHSPVNVLATVQERARGRNSLPPPPTLGSRRRRRTPPCAPPALPIQPGRSKSAQVGSTRRQQPRSQSAQPDSKQKLLRAADVHADDAKVHIDAGRKEEEWLLYSPLLFLSLTLFFAATATASTSWRPISPARIYV